MADLGTEWGALVRRYWQPADYGRGSVLVIECRDAEDAATVRAGMTLREVGRR